MQLTTCCVLQLVTAGGDRDAAAAPGAAVVPPAAVGQATTQHKQRKQRKPTLAPAPTPTLAHQLALSAPVNQYNNQKHKLGKATPQMLANASAASSSCQLLQQLAAQDLPARFTAASVVPRLQLTNVSDSSRSPIGSPAQPSPAQPAPQRNRRPQVSSLAQHSTPHRDCVIGRTTPIERAAASSNAPRAAASSSAICTALDNTVLDSTALDSVPATQMRLRQTLDRTEQLERQQRTADARSLLTKQRAIVCAAERAYQATVRPQPAIF